MPDDGGTRPSGAEDRREDKPFDRQAYYLSAKLTPRSLRSLPGIARSAVKLAYAASPRLFLLCAAAQILIAALLGVQVLLGKLALEAIFETTQADGSVADVLPPLIGLVTAGALGSFAGSFQTQAQRLLGEQVQRSTLDSSAPCC